MKNRFTFFHLFVLAAVLFLMPGVVPADNTAIESLHKTLKSIKDDSNKVNIANDLINEYITIGDYRLADSLIGVQMDMSRKLSYRKGIADAFINLGVVSNYQGDYLHSIDYLLKSLNINEEMNNKHGMAVAYKYMGTVYAREGDSTNATTYLHKALHLFIELKDTDYIATSLLSVGSLYQSQGDYTTALAHILKSLELYKKINEKDGIASSYMYIGNIYQAEGNYDKALDNLEQALNMFRSLQDKAGMATTNISIGSIYLDEKDYKKAMTMVEEGLQQAKEIGSLDDIEEAERTLSRMYELTGDKEKALAYYKDYVQVHDSAFDMQNSRKVTREEMNFEFEKKEALEKAEDEKKEMMQKDEVRKRELIIYLGSGMFLLVLGFAAYVYWSNIQRTRANKMIGEKNHQITESINYAQRIQQAMLPSVEEIQKALPQSFVLFRPKDIVSGDFYFFYRSNEKIYLAVADCTGHGVPGAFMSMICTEKLNENVGSNKSPGEILKILNKGLKASLHQSNKEESTHDGMDIALCTLIPSSSGIKMNFSGANRPLWIIRNGKNEVEEIEPTKKSVGAFTDDEQDYSTYIIQLQPGDTFYMFTDGYMDQFGGKEGKKLTSPAFKELLLSIKDGYMNEQEAELNKYIETWKGNMNQPDDILVMGIRV